MTTVGQAGTSRAITIALIAIRAKNWRLFAQLYDEAGTPSLQARLPALHARQLISVLEKFAAQPRRLGDLKGEYLSLRCGTKPTRRKMAPSAARPAFRTIRVNGCFLVLTSSSATPSTRPRAPSVPTKSHYDCLDLTILPDDYLPRTNYVPDCSPAEYRGTDAEGPLGGRQGRSPKHDDTDYYRIAIAEMLSSNRRAHTFTALIPPRRGAHRYCCQLRFQNDLHS